MIGKKRARNSRVFYSFWFIVAKKYSNNNNKYFSPPWPIVLKKEKMFL